MPVTDVTAEYNARPGFISAPKETKSGAGKVEDVTAAFNKLPGFTPAPKSSLFWPTNYKGINQGAHPGHMAWDIQAPMGSPIFAPVSGTVVKDVPMDPYGWGNAIQIVTADGKYHLYFAHLQSFLVSPGQKVTGGQEIGLADSTYSPPGYSSGSHLHFEVRDASGKAIDPQIFFNDESLTVPVDPQGPTITMGKVQQSMGASTAPAENAGATAKAPTSIPTASPAQSSLGEIANSAQSAPGATLSPAQTVSKTAAAGKASSSPTVLAQWDLMNSPVLGKITLKLTPSNISLVLGAIMVIIGMVQIGWKPAVKIAGVAAKAATA